MNTTNNILKSVLLCLVSLVASVAAMAENKVYAEDFSIIPGQEATVNVMMDNEDYISSLQVDLVLPAGLEYVEETAERNTARLTRNSHSFNVTDFLPDPTVTKRFTIFAKGTTQSSTAIKGNSGMIFSFNVKAAKAFNGGKLVLRNVIGSDATVVPAEEKPMNDSEMSVKVNAGTFSLSPEAVSVTLNRKDTIDVYMANTITLSAFEAKLNLPEGVEVEEMLMGDRLSDNVSVNHENGKILVESLTNDEFAESDAPLFSIVIKGVAKGTGTLSLSNVFVSNGFAAFETEGTANEVAVTVSALLGDVNNDGEVTPADVSMMASYLLGQEPEGFDESAADINEDGDITPADLSLLVSMLLGN